jgi:adenylyltransferase/sulfurtransferase
LARIADTSLAIVGCGGLGGAIVAILARYPFKRIKLIDRDVVETSNLAHQLLFTPAHAERGIAKVKAAREYIASVNPGLAVEPYFDDLRSANIERLLAGSDVVLDGLDNFRTRFLVNDWCVKNRIPYVYSGIVENSCSVKAVIPGVTSCLRCLMPEPPEPGTIRTCDVYGVHLPVLTLAASIAADLAIRIAIRVVNEDGGGDARALGVPLHIALDSGRIVQTAAPDAASPNPDCRACGGRYDFLDGAYADVVEDVCGQEAVAMHVVDGFDLNDIASKLAGEFEIAVNEFLVKADSRDGGSRFSVFRHGRVLLEGSRDASRLRSFVSRYIGV